LTCKPGPVRATRVATIHLGSTLPPTSCGLPAGLGGQPSNACAAPASRRLLTLLRVGFTEPPQSPAALVVSYTTVSPLPPGEPDGGLFSVALSRGSPRVGVTHHPALWSPDFPRRRVSPSPRPPGQLARGSRVPTPLAEPLPGADGSRDGGSSSKRASMAWRYIQRLQNRLKMCTQATDGSNSGVEAHGRITTQPVA